MPPKERKLSKLIFSVLAFILLEWASLFMVRNNGALQRVWLGRISHSVMSVLWGSSDNVRYYFSLKKQNDILAQENSRLSKALAIYQERESEAYRDSLYAELETSSDFIYIPATIIKMSRNKQHNYFIINKGAEDGILPQSGVITGNGVIGIIDAVDRRCSYGLTLMNTGLSISARIGSEGAVGPLTWDGRSPNGAILKEIPLQFKFEAGDTVWTSGYSAIFPPDIPMGVAGEAKIVNGAVNEISVELFENFSALRYVTVVENRGRDEINSLERFENANGQK